MILTNLQVDEVILHVVHACRHDRRAVPPTYGDATIKLEDDALDVFRDRIITAVGKDAKCMEMVIENNGPDSTLALANSLLGCDKSLFVHTSKGFADKLTDAQTQPNWPGGVLVIFRGKVGVPTSGIVGIIKAETDRGFQTTAHLGLEFVKNIFMTRETKLYKLGLFIRTDKDASFPEGWSAIVYDSLMTADNREAAAHYFYSRFLGCGLPENGARLTKQFFHTTRKFINDSNLPAETKADLFTSLYTYLKVEKSNTLQVSDFSNRFIDDDLQDSYRQFMEREKFPTNAVRKDTSEIQKFLRRRKIKFSHDIQLTAPSDAFEQLVTIKTLKVDGASGLPSIWTQITVQDHIRSQE